MAERTIARTLVPSLYRSPSLRWFPVFSQQLVYLWTRLVGLQISRIFILLIF